MSGAELENSGTGRNIVVDLHVRRILDPVASIGENTLDVLPKLPVSLEANANSNTCGYQDTIYSTDVGPRTPVTLARFLGSPVG